MLFNIAAKAFAIALIGASAVSAHYPTGTGSSPAPTHAVPYPYTNGTAPHAAHNSPHATGVPTTVAVVTKPAATPAPSAAVPVAPAPAVGTGKAPAPAVKPSGTGAATPYPTFATSGASSVQAAGLGLVAVAVGAMFL